MAVWLIDCLRNKHTANACVHSFAPKLKQWLPFCSVRPQGGTGQKRTGADRQTFGKTGFNHTRPDLSVKEWHPRTDGQAF
jgi:hypothetical protein